MATKKLVMGIIVCLSAGPIVLADDRIDNPLEKNTVENFKTELSEVNEELEKFRSLSQGKNKDIHSTSGVKLSKAVARSLRLDLRKVDGAVFNVSKKSLVKLGNKQGVYREREGYYKFLPAYILLDDKDGLKVLVNGVHNGDQIVINGQKLQTQVVKKNKLK